MKLFISHSLAPTDVQVALLLKRQAQAKGIEVESSQHSVPVSADLAGVISHAIARCGFVIAIVSRDSRHTAHVQYELSVAAALGKPTLALIEQGAPQIQHVGGIQFVEFTRHDLAPALTHISNILEGRKNQETLGKWLVGGGLALLALYLISENK